MIGRIQWALWNDSGDDHGDERKGLDGVCIITIGRTVPQLSAGAIWTKARHGENRVPDRRCNPSDYLAHSLDNLAEIATCNNYIATMVFGLLSLYPC